MELNFLVAEFLEKTRGTLGREMGEEPEKAMRVLERLHRILFSNRPAAFIFDDEDLESVDSKDIALLYHAWLKETWDSIKNSIFKYQEVILPMADESRQARKLWRQAPSIDAESPKPEESAENVEEYANLFYAALPDPEFFEEHIVDLPMPRLITERVAPTSQKPATSGREDLAIRKNAIIPLVKLVFNGKTVKFADRFNPMDALLDVLDGLPVSIFRKCPQCGGCFIETKIGKAYCTQLCAAKAGQKRRWQEDLEGSRERERTRYRKKKERIEASKTQKEEGE